MATFSTYVLNLDRHPDRLARMAEQLDAQGMVWVRFPAVDGAGLSDADLDRLVAPSGPIPRMPRGARACTASHIAILRQFLAGGADYALILEDDAEIASELGESLEAILAAGDFDILNLNRQTPRGRDKRLVVRRKASLRVGGFAVHDLVGIHYGTAGYVISRLAAQAVLERYARPDMPIDHILFNPNVSDLFGTLRIQQLFPALVRPRADKASSIQTVPVAGSDRLANRLKRAKAELSIVPRLLVGLAIRRYAVKALELRQTRTGEKS